MLTSRYCVIVKDEISDSVLLERYWALSERNRDAIDQALWKLMPFDWPGRDVVDLDAVGDPSAWMEDHLPERPAQTLFDAEGNASGILAEEYTAEVISQGYQLPSEFDRSDQLADLAAIQSDFRRFLTSWRERAVPVFRQHIEL